ncbi:uncharacterized protein RSE6_15145 [Rhynchosporium secalis]|uniref:Protein kinase domain-containing protein n=1 Tax=Rhynchosporium secalis TaxID=38038 RepID=A0A1E1MWS9_RHYSE|nr:uncharacterized protein RSE6_15145 [Rhynchosporium secalis]
MDLKSNRKTRFPGKNEELLAEIDDRKKFKPHRRTRFPGGTDVERIRLLEKEEQWSEFPPEKEQRTQLPFRLPIRINPPDVDLDQPVLKTNIKTSEVVQLPAVRVESPWNSYISLRHLERGGQVTVAYTRHVPVRMVTIKEILSDSFMELRKCQHENLLAIVEVYRFQGVFFVITDYTVITLKQIIAIPLPLEESHVSATCRQVFEGMQHLSRFGLCHKKLDSSRVLFSPDGFVKIAHFDECRTTESAAARSLGTIAIEMMQNGIPPEDGKFVLKHPDRWSPEASNFLEITSWGTLNEIQKHRFLTVISPTVMVPFIHLAGWDTIESLSLKTLDSDTGSPLIVSG